jgi:hypothetical protein
MAQYGFNVDTVNRTEGGAAGTLAYMLRGKLYYEYDGNTYDHTYATDFLHSEVLLPDYAPPEYRDPIILCNEMERAERRYDSRIGRTVWLSLQNELELDVWKELVRDFVNEAFVGMGMCAIIAIHESKHSLDPTKNNPNAHILLSDRPVTHEGFCPKKNREWNNKKHVRTWRRMWADIQNKVLEQKGLEKVSHESLEVQDKDREPTIPLGRAAMALERRGVRTERGDKNRNIEIRNREREERKHQPIPDRKRERERNRSR